MSQLYLMTTIADRKRLPDFMSVYEEHRLRVNMVALGRGTATDETMDLLGLDSSEKAVCFSFVSGHVWPQLKRELQRRLRIDAIPFRRRPPQAAISAI